ncbi:MAG: hypothetical protein ACXWOH_14085, partial [Bdellovibrionota bacterium]
MENRVTGFLYRIYLVARRKADVRLLTPITAMLALALFSGTGCPDAAFSTPGGSPSATPSTSASPTLSVAAGARAAKIIFRQSNPSGSFDSSPAGGTPAVPGSGQQANRVFNADGSLLATKGSSSWPAWLSSVEIGVSGANNTSSTNGPCAAFASAAEAAATNCDWQGGGAGGKPCGAPAGIFRVSEFDCQGTTVNGNGGPSDGVYIRAFFNRANLGTQENIMVVVEYAASDLNPAPALPTNCFSGGIFSPENCSDQTWKIFMKHSGTEVVQPFLMLIPPAFASVNSTTNSGGSGTGTRQFILPMSGDANLSVMQVSRIKTFIPNATTFTNTCS